MKRLIRRFGVRVLERLGIVYDEVDIITRPDVVVVLGRINTRRFLAPAPGGVQ